MRLDPALSRYSLVLSDEKTPRDRDLFGREERRRVADTLDLDTRHVPAARLHLRDRIARQQIGFGAAHHQQRAVERLDRKSVV